MRQVMRIFIALIAFGPAMAGIAVADQKFPSRPITLIVPFSAGGQSTLSADL